MSADTEIKPVILPNGATANFEIRVPPGEYTKVSALTDALSFDGVLAGVEGLASALSATMDRIKPSSAEVEFGVEVGFKEGKLLAFFVQGDAKANLKIKLVWGSS